MKLKDELIREMEQVIYECCDICKNPEKYAENNENISNNPGILKQSAIIEAMDIMYEIAKFNNDYGMKLIEKCSFCKFHEDISDLCKYVETEE